MMKHILKRVSGSHTQFILVQCHHPSVELGCTRKVHAVSSRMHVASACPVPCTERGSRSHSGTRSLYFKFLAFFFGKKKSAKRMS